MHEIGPQYQWLSEEENLPPSPISSSRKLGEVAEIHCEHRHVIHELGGVDEVG